MTNEKELRDKVNLSGWNTKVINILANLPYDKFVTKCVKEKHLYWTIGEAFYLKQQARKEAIEDLRIALQCYDKYKGTCNMDCKWDICPKKVRGEE